MPQIIIRYGPYMVHGIIDHRLQKVNGLSEALLSLGHEVELVPINEYNRLSIEMYEREIFRCDIRNLKFNMLAEDDPVCHRALRAIEEAHNRMVAVSNMSRYESELLEVKQSSTKGILASKSEMLFEENRTQNSSLQCDLIDETKKFSKVKIVETKTTRFGTQPYDEESNDI